MGSCYKISLTDLYGIGDSLVEDKSDGCTVVSVPHAPPDDGEASLPRGCDEGTTIGSVLHRVDEQHRAIVRETEVVAPKIYKSIRSKNRCSRINNHL